MIALIQRVTTANVDVDGKCIAEIKQGMLVFIGVEKNDSEIQADRLLQRILGYRIFVDNDDKMNLNLSDIAGGLLLVPQFTLAADTQKGMRPGFSSAANPLDGKILFHYLLAQAREKYHHTEAGEFGADMQVALVNDGPVTFWLQVGVT